MLFTDSAPSDAERMQVLAGSVVPVLCLVAVAAAAASGAEVWRYTILLDSRFDAVPAAPLRASDALVVTTGWLALVSGGLAVLLILVWLVRAYAAAAEAAGVRPARPWWQLVLSVLVPGVNLLLPGAVLAEIEHAALGADPARRPRPSQLVAWWWGLWAIGLLAAGGSALWSRQDSVQAQADGVILHAVTDLVAAAVAVLTAVVVRRFTALLSPVEPERLRRRVVVRVSDQPQTQIVTGGDSSPRTTNSRRRTGAPATPARVADRATGRVRRPPRFP
ncbi:MAG: DUF4328 domain-containing protein [Actinomycetota bacterium]|nr:DUF4328 domain-containing protein [Actinomycetota bacterium]